MRTKKSIRLNKKQSGEPKISGFISNISNSSNINSEKFNNSGENRCMPSRKRIRRKRNRSIESAARRKMKLLEKKRNRENSDILNNVPTPSSSNPNPVCDLHPANQESSSNQNETTPLKANSFNLFSKIFNDNQNQSIGFQGRKIKKKTDTLQTKKLLRKSVINLNNRDIKTGTNNCLKGRRTVKLKNHEENDKKSIFQNLADEIIVLDDEDDDQPNTICDNVQNISTNNADTYHSHSSTEFGPMDIDEFEPINQGKALNSPPQSSSNLSIINLSDSLDVNLFKTDNDECASTSNIFFKDINDSGWFKKLSTPSYTPIKGLTEINRSPPDRTNTITLKDKSSVDDSVIFVSESKADFIPLSGNKHIEAYHKILDSPFKVVKFKNTSTPKLSVNERLHQIKTSNNRIRKKMSSVQNRLLTAKEVAQNSKYNTNTYNPNPNKEEENESKKRMVIIDGSNVAFAHALSKEFSVKGLEICLEYFVKKGHEVKAVVPQFRLQKSKSTDPNKLEQLHKEGKIVFTPCKNLPGKSSTCYDDRFILQLAVEFDAAVVSNDNYRDLINENVAFKKVIENRVIGYSWCNDLFILPKDPYGKNGPGLSVILNRV